MMPCADSGPLGKVYEDTGGGDTTTSIWSFSPAEPSGEIFEFDPSTFDGGDLHLNSYPS